MPRQRVQSPQALLSRSPEVLSFQLHTAENDSFVEEVRSTSTLSVVTAARTTAAAMEITPSREEDREPSEATIPLQVNEAKRRDRPMKQQKLSGHSLLEEESSMRRRDESDTDGEWPGKVETGNLNGSRRGNGKAKGGSDR